jgi:hypothetical protein
MNRGSFNSEIRSYRSDAQKTERIRAMILSDDDSIDDGMECDGEGAMILSDDDSIDDGMECDGDYVGPTAVDSECADDDDCYDNCFHWKGQDEVGVK